MRKAFCFVGAILMTAIAVPCLAQSIHEQPNGAKVSGSFQLGSVTIPLPAGDWILTGRGLITANSQHGSLKIAEAYLTEEKGGKVTRGIYARANLKGQSTGYGWSRDKNVCDRNNVVHASFDRNFNPKQTKCWVVNHIIDGTPNNPTEAFKEFTQILAERKWELPKLRMSTVYYLTDSANYVYVNYAFNPETVGLALGSIGRWDSSDWNATRIGLFPDRVEFANKLRSYGEAILPYIEKGLSGQVPLGEFVPVKLEGWPIGAQ